MLLGGPRIAHHACRALGPDIRLVVAIGRHVARGLSRAGREVTPADTSSVARLPAARFDMLCSSEAPPAPEIQSLAAWSERLRPGGILRIVQSAALPWDAAGLALAPALLIHAGLVDIEQHRWGAAVSTTGRRP